MKSDKKLISLKEAAQISGYSSDYIGQLIRAGKIPGKQVYCNVAWMTTAEDVVNYKNQSENSENKNKAKKNKFIEYVVTRRRRVLMDLNVVKLFFTTFRSALPITILIIASFIFLNIFIYYVTNQAATADQQNKTKNEQPLSY
jgi:hypothetical protein